MDPQTLELSRVLQSGAHDAQSFDRIRALLSTQRPRLAKADDRATLADISELLEVWAESAPPTMAAAALMQAAQIAEDDLQQAERAVQLYSLSLDRDPSEVTALHKLEPLLTGRGERERFESLLAAQAQGLSAREGVDPTLPALLFRRLGSLRAERGELDAAIEAYEHVLDLNADADILRVLADAYSQRGGPADATQAADLYCTLGDVSGATDGVQWLERALDQVPSHDEALDLLETYIPTDRHAEQLSKRWQAYIDVSSNEPASDKRRMLLARVLAARGDARDALICLGPLIDRSDAEAVALQSECLTSLRADEARARESGTNGTAHVGDHGIAAYKPPTLVGFRVPPADPQPSSGEPVTATRPKPETAPVEPAKRVRAARSGETLVGFRVPAEFDDRPSATPAEAEAAQEPKPVSVVTLRSSAEAAQDLAPARAAGEPRAKSSTGVVPSAAPAAAKSSAVPASAKSSAGTAAAPKNAAVSPAPKGSTVSAAPKPGAVPLAKIQTRATMKGGFTVPAAAGTTTPTPASRAASGPAAAAAALKAAAGRSSSAPSQPPSDSSAALAKAAALRAALRDTVPASLVQMPSLASAPRASQPPVFPSRTSMPASAPLAPIAIATTETPPASSAAAAVLPVASSPGLAFDDASPFATRQSGSSRRWWIASAVALLALGGAFALISRAGSHSTPAPIATRGESQPAVPAPVVAPSTPPPTPTPSATPTPAPTSEPAAAAAAPSATAPEAATLTAAAPTKEAPAPAKEAPPARANKRAAQPEVKAVANQVKVRGTGVSAKEIVAALDDSLAKIERCYGHTLEQDARAQGQITFTWTIDKAGRAAKVHKVKATIKDAALQRCAGDAIEKTHFPKPKKHSIQVTAPFDFHKA